MRYGFEGAMLSIYGYERDPLKCLHEDDLCYFEEPKEFLEMMSMQNGNYWGDCFHLCLFFLVFRISGYFVLKYRLKNEN